MTSLQRFFPGVLFLAFLTLPLAKPSAAAQSPGASANPAQSAPSTKKILSKDFTLEGAKVWTDTDRKSTRLNSSHSGESRMPSSA